MLLFSTEFGRQLRKEREIDMSLKKDQRLYLRPMENFGWVSALSEIPSSKRCLFSLLQVLVIDQEEQVFQISTVFFGK